MDEEKKELGKVRDTEEIEEPEEEKEDKQGQKIIKMVGRAFLVLAIGAALYYFLIYDKEGEKAAKMPEPQPASVTEKAVPPSEQGAIPQLPPVELDKSDDLVRQLAKEISSHPRIPVWLSSDHLIRRFVASVDNLANGLSPRVHIDFFIPAGDFKIVKKGNLYYADPDGYSRYNPVVDVIISLDSKQCVYVFRSLKPLFQEAYRDLGYPDQDFQETFFKAIVELLKAPVVEGDVLLERTVVSYVMADPKLEDLSEAQKHLLRMGPENVGAIQTKLREIALALGFQEYRLPKPSFYTPQTAGN
jgi:hypothetical protein